MYKSAKDIINSQYREYAMYVLEQRAIPSCIDGLKPTARKLVCAGLEHARNKIKVAELGGMLSRYEYHHGEASAQSTLVGLAQDWNNNIPLFQRYGNFGSRLIQEAAASRYIFVKISDDFNKYFSDFEVCPEHYTPENPEPQTYLPIIPWVLVNGIRGIAVGFATDIQPRNPKELIKACVQYLKKGTTFNPSLHFPNFKGEIINTGPNTWQSIGVVEKSTRTTYTITELPWGYDRESYYNLLNKLEEEGKIDDFSDDCDDTGFKFSVKVAPTFRSKAEEDPITFFKLSKNHNENLTTLDEHGRLKLFGDATEIIKYFCDYRLEKIKEKIQYDIDKETQRNEFLRSKLSFIKHFVKEGVGKQSKTDMEKIAETFTNNKEYISKIVSIPFYDLSTEKVSELQEAIDKSDASIVKLQNLDAKSVFLERLQTL